MLAISRKTSLHSKYSTCSCDDTVSTTCAAGTGVEGRDVVCLQGRHEVIRPRQALRIDRETRHAQGT
jgi:hypothetical protein